MDWVTFFSIVTITTVTFCIDLFKEPHIVSVKCFFLGNIFPSRCQGNPNPAVLYLPSGIISSTATLSLCTILGMVSELKIEGRSLKAIGLLKRNDWLTHWTPLSFPLKHSWSTYLRGTLVFGIHIQHWLLISSWICASAGREIGELHFILLSRAAYLGEQGYFSVPELLNCRMLWVFQLRSASLRSCVDESLQFSLATSESSRLKSCRRFFEAFRVWLVMSWSAFLREHAVISQSVEILGPRTSMEPMKIVRKYFQRSSLLFRNTCTH